MVPPASHRISRVPRYSGTSCLSSPSPTGLSPSLIRLSKRFESAIFGLWRPATPGVRRPLVWPLPSSLATTKGIEFSFFSSGYLDVSLPRVPSMKLWIHFMVTGYCPAGFPHSEISGSRPTCGSPKLFAAYRVLHRQSVPWHPPCALVRLILPTIILPPKTWDFSPLEE